MQQEEQHFNIQPVQILNIMRGKPEQEEKQCGKVLHLIITDNEETNSKNQLLALFSEAIKKLQPKRSTQKKKNFKRNALNAKLRI